jgi:tyrosyl-tRNA synthetase
MTFPLLTTASGQKMGKTAAGAVWLDAEQLSAYEFYQFWINVDDRDVGRLLRLYTLLPLAEIARLQALQGAEVRQAKEVLAFEVTALTHGREAAQTAQQTSQAMFQGTGAATGVPQTTLPRERLEAGISVVDLFAESGLAASKGAARRLIQQGGASLNGIRVGDVEVMVSSADVQEGALLLRAGKKRYHRVMVV